MRVSPSSLSPQLVTRTHGPGSHAAASHFSFDPVADLGLAVVDLEQPAGTQEVARHTAQREPGDPLEDPVAGDELKVQHQRGGRDPPVGLMNLLHQRVTGPTGLVPQGRATCDQGVIGLDYVKVAERALQPA